MSLYFLCVCLYNSRSESPVYLSIRQEFLGKSVGVLEISANSILFLQMKTLVAVSPAFSSLFISMTEMKALVPKGLPQSASKLHICSHITLQLFPKNSHLSFLFHLPNILRALSLSDFNQNHMAEKILEKAEDCLKIVSDA